MSYFNNLLPFELLSFVHVKFKLLEHLHLNIFYYAKTFIMFQNGMYATLFRIVIFLIKLMKGKAIRKHSMHEQTAASVLLKLFINSNE